MSTHRCLVLLLSAAFFTASARELEPKPADPVYAPYEGWQAPRPSGCLLKPGDRLAICGDSITEQKMYGVLIEAYLTACLPELAISCRQYGWSGEQAGGFLQRMTNDVLRFKPTIATTCYGMNDHKYVPFTEQIGADYRRNQTGVVKAFQAAGARVVLGSPGTIDSVPHWVKSATGTKVDLNLSLNKLRNIDIEIAEELNCGFADVYWPMLLSMHEAKRRHGENFKVAGKDGVHPGWAGQVIMAYAFLTALGVDGDVGRVEIDLAKNSATGTPGHAASWADGAVKITSTRWPFCAPPGDASRDETQQGGLALIPFHEKLNRYMLRVTGISAKRANVTWGTETREYSREELEKGVNLAADFVSNPFSAPFQKLQDAVLAKQSFETKQIKERFHGRDGRTDMEATARATEAERLPLVEAITKAFHPVEHAIRITPGTAGAAP